MKFNAVQINKVDNGYVVNGTTNVFGEQRPEVVVKVFTDFQSVLDFLNPKPAVQAAN
jgi:hypothetical protein